MGRYDATIPRIADAAENLAYVTACIAHRHQLDKSGHPYIMHCERVADMLPDVDARIVALLHDTVEDTDITLDHLREEFMDNIVDAVDSVSKREGETYFDFIKRSLLDPIGCRVKLADLTDNNSPHRMKALSEKEQYSMGKRYDRAIAMLVEAGVTLAPPEPTIYLTGKPTW